MHWIELYRRQWNRRLDGLGAFLERSKGESE